METAFIWCYPQDLEAEGVEAAAARLAGEVGVDGLSVAALQGEVYELRPRRTEGPRIVREPAAAQFHPDAGSYTATRIRPLAAHWFKARDPLAKITEAASAQELSLRLWASCCDNPPLVEKHPMAGCVNVFGDSDGRWLCPSNPDVRQYLAALVGELSQRYAPAAIELWSLGFFTPDESALPCSSSRASGLPPPGYSSILGIPPQPWAAELLSWCFCPSCRQRAVDGGADAERAAAQVGHLLNCVLRFEPLPYASMEEICDALPVIGAFQKMRRDSVAGLLKSLRQKAERPLIVKVPGARAYDPEWIEPLAEHSDALLLLSPPADHAAWREPAHRLSEIAGGPRRVEIGLRTHPPAVSDGPDVVAEAHHAASAGHAAVGFFNDGATPQPALEWIRQAIRYARRES